MLPYLKNKHEAAAMGDEDEAIKRKHDESYDMLDAIAEDLFHAKDPKMVRAALESLCEYLRHEDQEQDAMEFKE